MKANELKKWEEMQGMGKKKYVLADGIVAIGLIGGVILTYIISTFFIRIGFFQVAIGTIPLMMAIGVFIARKKWTNMERIEAYDLKAAKKNKSSDDLAFLDKADEDELKPSNNKI